MSTSQVAVYRIDREVAVLEIDSPPVNALGHNVRTALWEGVSRAIADADAAAVVLICGGRTFFAGADVTEIGKPILPPLLADVMGLFEASSKPIVAAMHGTPLGGGLELALACHYRVAVPSAMMGLPEVALGLMPGAGGTQRLPRLIGVAAAVDLIGRGRRVKAAEALELGLVDALVPEHSLEQEAVAYTRELVAEGAPLRRLRDLPTDLSAEEARPVFNRFRKSHPDLFVGLKASEAVLQAIEAATSLPFEQGLGQERDLARALIEGPESAAQRHLFFAERAAAKLLGTAEKAPVITGVSISGDWPERQAVESASLCSHDGEIEIFADDLPLDAYREVLLRARAKVVIAVRHLDSLDALAEASGRQGSLVGLNVFSGVWEIVLGEHSDAPAALAVMALARRLGRPAIFVSPAPGLVLQRLADRLAATIDGLLAEGVPSATVAASGRSFGFRPALLPDGDGESDETIERRLVHPLLREALAITDAGLVKRPSDVDFAAVRAGLFPLWRGGPSFMAERIGRDRLEPSTASEPAVA